MTLAWWGYVPKPELGVQSDETIFGIQVAAFIAPGILNVLGLFCLWRFSLDEIEHARALRAASSAETDGQR